MIFWGFIVGMILCAITLSLLHMEGYRSDDRLASAGATFSAWCAFGMLLMAGTYGLGLIVPGVVAAAVLVVRTTTSGSWLAAFAVYKLPFGIAALAASLVTWIGVLNLMEELPNG